MQIRVLGCSGSIAAGSRTTSFLVDDDVLIDAGTGIGDLSLDELARIDHILVTHSHLDHVLGIGLMADTVARKRIGGAPIRVHALPATLEALRKHIFNGVIWPDFTRLPSAEQPLLTSALGAPRCCRPNTRCRRSASRSPAPTRPPAPGSSPATPVPIRRFGGA
jgi:glyoxylase-like metal-dependent hydrolase (beta-lactamase superfamily II)